MLNDQIKLKGTVHLVLAHRDGTTTNYTTHNLVTTLGKSLIAERAFYDGTGSAPASFATIKTGNSNTAADVSQTDLQGNQTVDNPINYSKRDDNVIKYFAAFTDTAEDTFVDPIKEVGLFADDGVMICRTVLETEFTKQEEDLLTVYWSIEIG